MPRLLLLLPSSTYRAADFVASAARLGVQTQIAGDSEQTLAAHMAEKPLRVDFDEIDESLDTIRASHELRPIDAVVAADETGVRLGAAVVAALGLVGNTPEAVAATRDKALMRDRLAAGGVAQPRHQVSAGVPAGMELPCVVKPVSLSASRGVIRADTVVETHYAARRIRAMLAEDPACVGDELIFEEYVDGPEVSVEALLRGGELEVLAIFDKPDPLEGPYFEETIYVTPARLADGAVQSVRDVTAAAAAALGLVEGPVHAELRLGAAGPVVIEVAARSIGGLCSRTLRFGAGISLEDLIVRHACAMPVDDTSRAGAASGVMMLPISREGTLAGVDGIDEALDTDGITGIEITIPPGRHVRPPPEGDRYLGFLFARAESADAAEAALRAAHARLDIRIE